MGESRRAEECTGISLPITHLNKPTSQHWPAYSLPLLCDGRGGGREEQGHPEEDDDHRQPCKPGFPAQAERAALVEDPGGRCAGRGGEPAGDPCPQAAPGSLLPLLQLQVCPAHASENTAAMLSSKRVCYGKKLWILICVAKNVCRFSSAWEGKGDCRDSEGRERVQVFLLNIYLLLQ